MPGCPCFEKFVLCSVLCKDCNTVSGYSTKKSVGRTSTET